VPYLIRTRTRGRTVDVTVQSPDSRHTFRLHAAELYYWLKSLTQAQTALQRKTRPTKKSSRKQK
jgi:hypothetical protein